MGEIVKIDKIVLVNYKNHEKYEQQLSGNSAILVGINGAGKTSILEAVKRCLGMVVDKPQVPIRKGSDNSKIQVYLRKEGDVEEYYVSEETYTKKDSKGRLKLYRVKDSYRDALTSPMDRLKDLIGNPVDLTPIILMNGKEQFEFLFEGLFKEREGVKTLLHDYQNLYDDRTLVNRDVAGLKTKLADPEFAVVNADIETYVEEKSITELQQKKKPLTEVLNKISDAKLKNQDRQNKITALDGLKEERKDMEEKLRLLNERITNGEKWAEENPVIELADLDLEKSKIEEENRKVDEEISQVSDHNKMVVKCTNFLKAKEELVTKETKSNDLSTKIKEKKAEVNNAIKIIPFGEIVEGLSLKYEVDEKTGKVSEIGLFMNDLPFHKTQQSYGELLKAIIKLTCYLNPDKLNFIPIGDYSLLDEENQKEIWEFVKNNPDLHIQIIAEKVNDNKTLITELVEL